MSSSPSLLSLPSEIREHIYAFLLHADENFRPIANKDPSTWWKFDVRIFRTCKQIYRESERVFRRINSFVKLNTPWGEAVERTKMFALTPVLCRGVAAQQFQAWQMNITVDYTGTTPSAVYSFVVDVRDLVGFCRMWYYFDISAPGLNSHFGLRCTIAGLPDAPERELPIKAQTRLFDPWKLVRRLESFDVVGPHNQAILAALREAMKEAYPQPIDCLERCDTAKEAGNLAFKAGAYREALAHYARAFEAIHIIVDGARRSVWAENYFDIEVRSGRFQGQYGGTIYMTLRLQLVANSIMAYNRLEDWSMAYTWGLRSINILRHHYGAAADEPRLMAGATSPWGKIYYQTAVAARALDNMTEAREFIRIASKYLPDDRIVQGEYNSWGCLQLA